jgi:hypothetical protein
VDFVCERSAWVLVGCGHTVTPGYSRRDRLSRPSPSGPTIGSGSGNDIIGL